MQAKRRLLFIGPLPEPLFGQSLACQVLLDSLSADYSVDIIDTNRDLSQMGKGAIHQLKRLPGDLMNVWKLSRKADAIYYNNGETVATNLKDILFYLIIGRRMNRTVIHLHGGAGMRRIMRGRHPILAKINGFALRKVSATIVLGPRLVDIYSEHLNSSQIKTAENFAEDRWFISDEDIEQKHNNGTPIRLLFLSNLLAGKGYLELANALAQMDPKFRAKFQVDFAGGFSSAVSENEFRNIVQAIPEVTYHGSVKGDAKASLLSQAHVFCLPTYYPYEGQPISILEAYASGAAVITTDHSGIFDTFTDGVNGWAVEKASVPSLAACLTSIAADPTRLRPIGLENARTARKKYKVEHFIDRVRPIIDAAAG